ncbi:MAG: hypothetical protein ACR2PH_03240 [Desulfobulbia bacterium]
MSLNVIKDEYVENVCKRGEADCCSYLGFAAEGWTCLKLQPGLKATIDRKRAAKAMRAMGDNCLGYEVDVSGVN